MILGYHGIADVDPRHDPLKLYVSPESLGSHVRSMQDRGYRFVTMSEFADRLREDATPPRGIGALTFDDGTSDHATLLPGLLAELGVPGTVYVCPGLAGAPYPWTDAEAGLRFMTEPELVELARDPLVEIGAHTNEHHELHEADAEMALREMADCKETLEALLGGEVGSFCYPRCHYSEAARESAKRAGYKSAVTCGMRGSWDPFALKREVLHGDDGPLVAAMRLRGRYAGAGAGPPARALRWMARKIDSLVPSGSPQTAPDRA